MLSRSLCYLTLRDFFLFLLVIFNKSIYPITDCCSQFLCELRMLRHDTAVLADFASYGQARLRCLGKVISAGLEVF